VGLFCTQTLEWQWSFNVAMGAVGCRQEQENVGCVVLSDATPVKMYLCLDFRAFALCTHPTLKSMKIQCKISRGIGRIFLNVSQRRAVVELNEREP